MKIRAEVNRIENGWTADKSQNKSWFSETGNKTDKSLHRLTKKKGEKAQSAKFRNERGDITTDLTERRTGEYYDQL